MNNRFLTLLFFLTLWGTCIYAQPGGEIITSIEHKVKVPGEWVHMHPDEDKGWYQFGLGSRHDGTYDLQGKYGIRFQVKSDKTSQLMVKCRLVRADMGGSKNLVDSTETDVRIETVEGEWQTVTLPFSIFDFNKGQDLFLRYIQSISLRFEYANRKQSTILLKDVRIVEQESDFLLTSDILSRPLDESLTTEYQVKVQNVSEQSQSYALNVVRKGWEGFKVSVSPQNLFLNPGEVASVSVKVVGNSYLPAGAHEKHCLQVVPLLRQEQSREMEFITVMPVASPFLVHQEKGWNDVKKKIEQYEWAQKEFDKYIQTAEKFEVPEVKKGTMSDQGTEGLVRAYIEGPLFQTAVAWKISGNKAYGQKVAEMLRRISDPELGYPRTNHLTLQGIPQEGGTFEGMIRSYDLIRNSDLLTNKDRAQIEYTFRLFCNNMIDLLLNDGGISNWTVFNIVPAAQATLLLHDLDLFNKLMYGPCGIVDQFRYGTMDDGWWYEVSLSYNIGAAECFTQLIPAARPFGIDLQNMKFPSSLTRKVGLRPFEFENFLGMSFGKYGPLTSNTIDIKKLWDGILIYPDYRGVMFGMGDGHETLVGGSAFELAYFVFRDPNYAAVIKQSGQRNLIYGVPELPEDTPRLYTLSGHSDNAGIVVLRSQTQGREPREQIQAALKYGTHGSYHGHFDKVSLLSLMRYGRSFWNPETSWYGYGSYMYKWWVQPSMAHNMVVVDGKMQEPTDSYCSLFHSGEMMQAAAVETYARWSNPPYMGGYEQVESVRKGDAPYVPIPDNHPSPGDVTDYTSPVWQRRLLVVTDDYVIVGDYLKSSQSHTFDNLLHLRGVEEPAKAKFLSHTPFFDANPLSSGQFISNVKDYSVRSGIQIHSCMQAEEGISWDKGGFNGCQEAGPLNIDVHYAWPHEGVLRIGTYPDALPVRKKVSYWVETDGKTVLHNEVGMWIMGTQKLCVPVKQMKELKISIQTHRRKEQNTLFLADLQLVTAQGKNIKVPAERIRMENIKPVSIANQDYAGGSVVLSGKEYLSSIPVEPEDTKQSAILVIDLENLDAVEFKGVLGGDFPVGEDSQVRRTVSYRIHGTEASYLTVLEPYEHRKMVKKVTAPDASTLKVELTDGRVQLVKIEQLCSEEKPIKVIIIEKKGNKIIRQEES